MRCRESVMSAAVVAVMAMVMLGAAEAQDMLKFEK